MNTTTTRTQELPGRPPRGALDQETIDQARTSPWEPGASSGAPKVLVGLAGAALVGGIALGIVLLSPSPKTAKPAANPPVAAEQGAPANPASGAGTDSFAAQANPTPTDAAAVPRADDGGAAPQASPEAPATPPDANRAPGSTNPARGE
jgi:hypothetical protein